MNEYLPLLIMGAVIGVITIAFIVVYKMFGKINPEDDFERNMPDGEIVKRLLVYIKPYYKSFVVVFIIMAISIVYELVSPLITGEIISIVQRDFELSELYRMVGIYISILAVSLVCTYTQAMILQKIGQKILSDIREDVFTHIEK
ncbi:MAG: ABC transporter ATP-binding protein, partial [Oscillospiraceae bacterium]|nr:ABC transporter ATP-binding protein [Oscillospiraceae bacterium]